MASKKQGGIFGSMIGMLIGLGLVVLLSPYLLWHAQSQDRAKEFQTATVVESSSSETGYIVVEGMATNVDELVCPKYGEIRKAAPIDRIANSRPPTAGEYVLDYENEDDYIFEEEANVLASSNHPDEPEVVYEPIAVPIENENCLYVAKTKEVYESSEVEQCGDIESNQEMIKRIEDQCDEYGEDCEPCYLVREYDWSFEATNYEYSRFTIGSYTINPAGGANLIGSEGFVDYVYQESEYAPVVGDIRYDINFMKADQEILVAGEAEGNEIEGAYDGKPYVISNKSYAGTLEALEMQDKAMGWMLRIGSLLAMIFGMLMIVGPLTYFSNIFRAIPVLGKHVDKGFDGVIKTAAVVTGIVLWLLIYALVLLLKNILIVIVVLGALGAIALYLMKSGKVKLGKQG